MAKALMRLELAGEMVPSLDWFIYTFVRKEAVLSSQIEGTQATLVDLLIFEAEEGAGAEAKKPPNADVEEGHRSTTFALLANIALATRKRLDWDPQAERFLHCEEANQLLHYEYRKPWSLT